MNQLERWVVLANAALATVACVVNFRVGLRSSEPWRSVRIPIAGLAGLYAAAYLWLFFTQDIGPWSSVMRGVSILSWPVVWIRPAVINGRVVKVMRTVIERADRKGHQ